MCAPNERQISDLEQAVWVARLQVRLFPTSQVRRRRMASQCDNQANSHSQCDIAHAEAHEVIPVTSVTSRFTPRPLQIAWHGAPRSPTHSQGWGSCPTTQVGRVRGVSRCTQGTLRFVRSARRSVGIPASHARTLSCCHSRSPCR